MRTVKREGRSHEQLALESSVLNLESEAYDRHPELRHVLAASPEFFCHFEVEDEVLDAEDFSQGVAQKVVHGSSVRAWLLERWSAGKPLLALIELRRPSREAGHVIAAVADDAGEVYFFDLQGAGEGYYSKFRDVFGNHFLKNIGIVFAYIPPFVVVKREPSD